MNKEIIYEETTFAGRKLSFETGLLANMSNLAVTARYGDTVVLVTAISADLVPDVDFLPLKVEYQEKFYASGSIKNSRFQKRDGRNTDEAIIAGRVIDHAIRPLFPKDFRNDTQVVATVLSLDPDSDANFLSMIATSAALYASDIPWNGPIFTVRVGYIDGDYVLNPTLAQLNDSSDLDMIVSFVGKEKKFMAVEAEANILPENKILGAIEFARDNVDPILDLIERFASRVNPERKKLIYESQALSEDLLKDVSDLIYERLDKYMNQNLDKYELEPLIEELREETHKEFEGKYKISAMDEAISELEKKVLQSMILDKEKRPDGRGIKEIRPISIQVGLLPRTHGSGLFTRGITQVLTTATLASPSMELLIQDMYGERAKRFLHYYNFPPYASGEVGKFGLPKNREIGHGMIAENGLRPVIPSQEEFPYMIMLVSETMSSSGSTSMAATCGSTLALMDAGVPIKDMVAGIGVGLIANEDFSRSLIMTDLAYMEDAFGLLDFKMTGTETGVTAIQCDMKVPGIPMELLPRIIEQSREGRLYVLSEMRKTISQPRAQLSKYAPKSVTIKIDPDKIGLVIGSGGKTIKDIQEKTSAVIAIEEDGTVVITSDNEENANKARDIVEGMTKDIKPGEIYEGVVEEVVDFGAFVEILPGKVGLLHVSEISNDFVKNPNDVIKAGDIVKVKVLEVQANGKIALSKKALDSSGDFQGSRRESRSSHDSRNQRPSRREPGRSFRR